MKKKKDDPDLHLKITLHDSIHHSNSQARKLPNCNHRFSSGTTRDLLPVAIFKNFAPSSLIAISNFKEEKMIHFALNRTMNRGKLCSLHRFTKFVKTSNLPNRSKSGSGSFEAEWKAIGSSSVIRFLQRIRKWTAHRAPSWPVMNRILIAANRSRIAVIRFGLLSIYNEVSSLSSDCTNHCTPIWKITNPFLARLHCHRIEYVPFIIVLFEIKRRIIIIIFFSFLSFIKN